MGDQALAGATLDLARRAADGIDVTGDALALIDRYVGVDIANYSALRLGEARASEVEIRGADPLTDDEVDLWERLAPTHAYVAHVSFGPMETSRLTDVVDLAVFERTELYQRLLAPRDSRYQAALPLRRAPGDVVLLSAWRAATDFDDGDLARLEVVRSALAAALAFHAEAERLRRMAGWSDPITGRQRQVVVLVAAGLTNDQIARRLGISPRTVRKHVADLFERSGTTSRTTLALHFRGEVRPPGGA